MASNNERPDFQRGDHVYQNCDLSGIPHVFQHHAIVLDVTYNQRLQKWNLVLVDFTNWGSNLSGIVRSSGSCPTSFSDSRTEQGLRTYEDSPDNWYKVKYNASSSCTGASTVAESCPPYLVRARAEFLLKHPHYVPSYSLTYSNCECVAVWCKTGIWATLQAASALTMGAIGGVTTTATAAAVASVPVVTVPAAGMWGWLGYTTQVSLATVLPVLLPAIAIGGIIAVGVPSIYLLLAQKKCEELTKQLNEAFGQITTIST